MSPRRVMDQELDPQASKLEYTDDWIMGTHELLGRKSQLEEFSHWGNSFEYVSYLTPFLPLFLVLLHSYHKLSDFASSSLSTVMFWLTTATESTTMEWNSATKQTICSLCFMCQAFCSSNVMEWQMQSIYSFFFLNKYCVSQK